MNHWCNPAGLVKCLKSPLQSGHIMLFHYIPNKILNSCEDTGSRLNHIHSSGHLGMDLVPLICEWCCFSSSQVSSSITCIKRRFFAFGERTVVGRFAGVSPIEHITTQWCIIEGALLKGKIPVQFWCWGLSKSCPTVTSKVSKSVACWLVPHVFDGCYAKTGKVAEVVTPQLFSFMAMRM